MSRAAYSPWAPADGWSETSGRPVTLVRICSSRQRISSAPWTVASGWFGWSSAAPVRRARSSETFGLYFIVHEPSGYGEVSIPKFI